jgi:hypothetical protein
MNLFIIIIYLFVQYEIWLDYVKLRWLYILPKGE